MHMRTSSKIGYLSFQRTGDNRSILGEGSRNPSIEKYRECFIIIRNKEILIFCALLINDNYLRNC